MHQLAQLIDLLAHHLKPLGEPKRSEKAMSLGTFYDLLVPAFTSDCCLLENFPLKATIFIYLFIYSFTYIDCSGTSYKLKVPSPIECSSVTIFINKPHVQAVEVHLNVTKTLSWVCKCKNTHALKCGIKTCPDFPSRLKAKHNKIHMWKTAQRLFKHYTDCTGNNIPYIAPEQSYVAFKIVKQANSEPGPAC